MSSSWPTDVLCDRVFVRNREHRQSGEAAPVERVAKKSPPMSILREEENFQRESTESAFSDGGTAAATSGRNFFECNRVELTDRELFIGRPEIYTTVIIVIIHGQPRIASSVLIWRGKKSGRCLIVAVDAWRFSADELQSIAPQFRRLKGARQLARHPALGRTCPAQHFQCIGPTLRS